MASVLVIRHSIANFQDFPQHYCFGAFKPAQAPVRPSNATLRPSTLLEDLNIMNIQPTFNSSPWFIGLLSAVLLSGCGSWDDNSEVDPDPDNGLPVAAMITAFSPDNQASDVPVTYAPTATFNAAMNANSLNTTTFTLTGPNDSEVEGEVTYSSANMTATFTPDENLEFNTIYTAVVTTGALNELGTPLAAEQSWTFTTMEEQELALSATNPSQGGTACTNRAIRATFNMPVDAATIESPATSFSLVETVNTFAVDGEVSLHGTENTATFTPDSELTPGIEYTVTITTEVTDTNGNALSEPLEWAFTTSDEQCGATIELGMIEPYGVLSNTGVTLGGGPDSTTGLRVDGNVGIYPSGECVGCDGTTVSGVIEIGNTEASDSMLALEAAYDDAIGRTVNLCTLINSGILTANPSATCGGGEDGVFPPGLYWSGTSIAIPVDGTITLDAQNDSDAVFIFQSESSIDTIGGNTNVILANGAQAKNVFWVAVSSATIGGTDSTFAGTILALIGITVNTGTEMNGRAFARGAEVTVQDDALIIVPVE